MPRPTIEQVRGLGDVTTTYQWNFIFVTFPEIFGGVGEFPASEDLNLRMISTSLPIKGNTDQEIKVRGHKTYQSGQVEYSNELVMTFYETADNIVSNFFLAWNETCVQTGTGVHGSKSNAECVAQIQRLNRQDIPIWLYTLIGCKLKTYTLTDLSGEDDTLKPALTIKWDYFKEVAL